MTVTPPEVEIDESVLVDLDAEWEIACDYSKPLDPKDRALCDGNPAAWIGMARCPECKGTVTRLLCTDCKELVMTTEHGCRCVFCDERIVPFRRVFVYFTPLKSA